MPAGPASGEPLTLAGLDEALSAVAAEKGRARPSDGSGGSAPSSSDRRGRPPLPRRAAARARCGRARSTGWCSRRSPRRPALPAAEVRQAAMFAAEPGRAGAGRARARARRGLGRFSLRLLSPVAPMLASPAGDVEEALERLGEAAFEYKLDGARIQVHRAGDEVRVFTRQLQDVTGARARGGRVGARPARARGSCSRARRSRCAPTGGRSPFQVTMRRFGREARRRGRAPRAAALVLLLRLPVPRGRGPARRAALRRAAERLRASWRRRRCCRAWSPRDARGGRALLRAGASPPGHEGLMAKSLDGPVRGRPARLPLAEAQAGPHARPGGARRRVGQRPAPGLAVQPAPRRARRGERPVRDARQDLQGPDRRDAALADGDAARRSRSRATSWTVHVRPELVVEIAFATCRSRRATRPASRCASRGCKRYRPGQAGRGGRHAAGGARDLRAASAPETSRSARTRDEHVTRCRHVPEW